MKLRIILVSLIGLAMIISACSGKSGDESLVKSEYGDLPSAFIEEQTIIQVTTDKKEYSSQVNEITLSIANTGTTAVGYGTSLYVEKLINGKWYQIPYKRLAFEDIALGIEANSSFDQEVPLDHLYYQFTEGNYRITKSFFVNEDKFVLGAEFEIKE